MTPALSPQTVPAPQIPISGLVDRANAAIALMSRANPNRRLILQLGSGLVELAGRVDLLQMEAAQLRRELAAMTARAEGRDVIVVPLPDGPELVPLPVAPIPEVTNVE